MAALPPLETVRAGHSRHDPDQPMAYGRFADIYDRVMRSVDYEAWAEYVLNCCYHLDLPREPLLNVACGTGNLEIELHERGVGDITSVDASDDMLRVAEEKFRKEGMEVSLHRARMQHFDLGRTFGLVTCLYDSVNYLTSLEDLEAAIASVYRHVRPGGAFIFDVTTEFNIIRNFADYTFAENYDDYSYIWENRYNIRTKLIVSKLTIFGLEDGVYRKYREEHVQKIFPRKAVEKAVKRAGFDLAGSYSEMTFDAPHPRSERIHFVARRREDR
jgi:ubiquinone/menaquinone biosynthesis C-methylase UbiE